MPTRAVLCCVACSCPPANPAACPALRCSAHWQEPWSQRGMDEGSGGRPIARSPPCLGAGAGGRGGCEQLWRQAARQDPQVRSTEHRTRSPPRPRPQPHPWAAGPGRRRRGQAAGGLAPPRGSAGSGPQPVQRRGLAAAIVPAPAPGGPNDRRAPAPAVSWRSEACRWRLHRYAAQAGCRAGALALAASRGGSAWRLAQYICSARC